MTNSVGIVDQANEKLFQLVLTNPNHVSSSLLPDKIDQLTVRKVNVPPNTLHVIKGTGFAGQMTQPTVSKHWRKIGPKD